MSFTINAKGKLKIFSFSPRNLEYTNLQKQITQSFCKLNYKKIYNYLNNISEFRHGHNVHFEIIYKQNR